MTWVAVVRCAGPAIVDLHCHLLPDVDDGAGSLEESLWMARFYVAEGTRYVVATPHCYQDRPLLRTAILPAVSAGGGACGGGDSALGFARLGDSDR
jgi:Capsular polysaccharide synthesis, CpsB/CapC